MDVLAHYTLRRCANCGVIGNSYPIHSADCPRPATERIDVVPAARLEGAVEALRRIAAGHAHPSKLAGEALDALKGKRDG